MKSFTTLRNLYGDLTKNTNAANLTLADILLNDEHRKIITSHPFSFLEKSSTEVTVASQQPYDLPGDLDKLANVTISHGSIIDTPIYKPSRIFWDMVNDQATPTKSDTVELFTIFGGQVLFYPTPSTAGNTITFYYRRRIRDMSVADYTTGTIVTTVNGDETIVGSGTSWTTGMADKYIRITSTNAANVGDGKWYEISSITDGTNLELVAPYEGTAITAGSGAYTLADVPLLPESFHDIILWRPLADYWFRNDDADLAKFYLGKFKDDFKSLITSYGSPTDNIIVEEGMGDRQPRNPNLFVEL